MKKLFLILVLLFSIPAQAEEAKHQCQSSDPVGLWQTAGFNENPPGPLTENFKNFPYEYLIFSEHNFAYDGRKEAANVSFKSKEDLTNFVKEVYGHSKLAGKFTFSVDNGIITILRDDKPWQKFQCFIMDSDISNGMKKDDMIWIVPGASEATPAVMRIERRLIKK